MIGIISGVVTKTGSSQYGGWCLVEEAEVTTKSGKSFTPRTMCSGDSVPEVGAAVVAQGYVTAKVSENGGNHYANTALNGCRFTILSGDAPKPSAAEDDDDIPFAKGW